MAANVALNVAIVTILFAANINAIYVLDTTKINNIIYRQSFSFPTDNHPIVTTIVIKIQKRNKIEPATNDYT